MKNAHYAFLALCALALGGSAFASGGAERESHSQESFAFAVGRELGHRLDEFETVIADATWLWYDEKQGHEWDRDLFAYAVERGVKNCSNEAMIAAAKTGKFGEKLLKALIVTAGEAAESFSAWVEETSDRYDEKR